MSPTPGALVLRISASYLRDPLALWGVLGYSRAFGDRPGAASLSLTTALVANTAFTLYAGVSYQAPVGGVAVPTASLSLGAGFAFNPGSKLYIGDKGVVTGGVAGLGLQLGLSGSSPESP